MSLPLLSTCPISADLIGLSGSAVGGWVVQMAVRRGLNVYGTASSRSLIQAERLGANVFDYREPSWIRQLVEATTGGVDGIVDHAGDREIRAAVRPGGRIVRIAFGGQPGKQRRASAGGFMSALARRYSRPSERICSVPIFVSSHLFSSHQERYRHLLTALLGSIAAGELVAPGPRSFSVPDYAIAIAIAIAVAGIAEPGVKIVIVMPGY